MTTRRLLGVWTAGSVVVAALLTTGLGLGAIQQPVFRTATARVSVNVSVRSGNVPTAGLQAADFDLLDNGVPQTVVEVGRDAVPIDVTLVVDTSGSTTDLVEKLRRDAREIALLLRAVDRYRVMSIDAYVHELAAMQPAGAAVILNDAPSGGSSSVHDALVAAMIQPVDLDRRHLILAMTDAYDTFSVLDAPTVRAVAARSEAVLHILLVNPSGPISDIRPLLLWRDRDIETLTDAADRTGGRLHQPGIFGTGTVHVFKEVFEDFRSSYLVYFTPTGVARTGWHDLSVRIRRPGKFNIRARKGYFAG